MTAIHATHDPRSAREEAELLAAIVAEPDDNGLRLVYADWLHTRGDPRGELIVLQNLLADAGLAPGHRTRLEARERELFRDHPSSQLSGTVRGFPEALHVDGARLVAMRAELVTAPIRTLRLTRASSAVADIATMRELSRIQSLALDPADHEPWRSAFDTPHMELLAASPYLTSLRRFELGEHWVGPRGAAALGQARWLPGLTELVIHNNPFGRSGIPRLVGTANLARLRVLRLLMWQLDDADVEALVSSDLSGLRELEIKSTTMSSRARSMIETSRRLPNLETLDIVSKP